MSERRTIGQILMGLGRISEGDIALALDHQREHGGFFGEALIAKGVISPEELEFGIASQFDLPYVNPDPASIDLAVASLVSVEWALRHNMLPILQVGDELRVVTDSPMKDDAVEHLQAQTGCEVVLSLSSPTIVRDTIRQVYAMASASDEEPGAPVDLSEAVGIVVLLESPRFGISVRGALARFWWDEDGVIRRRPLSGDWRGSLDRSLSPSPSEVSADGPRSTWEARLTTGSTGLRVRVESLVDESGRELLFVPVSRPQSVRDRFSAPPEGIVSEIRLLARSGAARFLVHTASDRASREIIPHLPELTLDPSWRSIYLHSADSDGADETFSIRLSGDPALWMDELNELRPFHFDVVTVDLEGGDPGWAEVALDMAAVTFLYWPRADDTSAMYGFGVRWVLRVERGDGDTLNWSLEALNP